MRPTALTERALSEHRRSGLDELEDAYRQFVAELEDLLAGAAKNDELLHFRADVSYGHYLPGNLTLGLSGADTMVMCPSR